jgi:hypothetical protein
MEVLQLVEVQEEPFQEVGPLEVGEVVVQAKVVSYQEEVVATLKHQEVEPQSEQKLLMVVLEEVEVEASFVRNLLILCYLQLHPQLPQPQLLPKLVVVQEEEEAVVEEDCSQPILVPLNVEHLFDPSESVWSLFQFLLFQVEEAGQILVVEVGAVQ